MEEKLYFSRGDFSWDGGTGDTLPQKKFKTFTGPVKMDIVYVDILTGENLLSI